MCYLDHLFFGAESSQGMNDRKWTPPYKNGSSDVRMLFIFNEVAVDIRCF